MLHNMCEVAKYALQQQTQLHHTVIWFAMVQFMGHLITVGGGIEDEMHKVTGNVYCFNEQSQRSSSNPCQPLDIGLQLPLRSLPLLPVGE